MRLVSRTSESGSFFGHTVSDLSITYRAPGNSQAMTQADSEHYSDADREQAVVVSVDYCCHREQSQGTCRRVPSLKRKD